MQQQHRRCTVSEYNPDFEVSTRGWEPSLIDRILSEAWVSSRTGQSARLEAIAKDVQALLDALEELQAKLARVEALAEECEGQHGQCWNSIFARRIRTALDG
jgi:hypothetical protein